MTAEDMMPFVDIPIDDLTSDNVSSLLHHEETQRLDFKRVYGANDGLEIARDICAFANAEGGYIIVGADESNGKCSGFRNVDATENFCQRVRNIAHDCISERIDGLRTRSIRVLQPDEMELDVVVIYIPRNSYRKPHMVKKGKRTEFWLRYEQDKKLYTIAELRDAFLQNAALPYAKIEAKLDDLIGDKKRQQRVRISEDVSQLNEISDMQDFTEAVDRHYENKMGSGRYLRLTITPDIPCHDRLDIYDAAIRQLIEHPPGQRESGWNMKDYETCRTDVLGIYASNSAGSHIRLFRNGHLEFRTPINEFFCWKQPEEGFRRVPRLYPYAVIEYPVSFLRLAKELYDTNWVPAVFIWRMIYWNLKGCVLLPGHPQSPAFLSPLRVTPYQHPHYQSSKHIGNSFSPDECAYEAIKGFYAAFNHDETLIPFFDENHRMVI